MLTVVFQGIESRTHLETLKSVLELFDETPRIAAGISYKSLRSRRLGPAYVKETATHFPVVLDAGVATTPMDEAEALRTANEYYSFLRKVPQITAAVEFQHSTVSDYETPEDPRIVLRWDGVDPRFLSTILNETGSVVVPEVALDDKRVPAVLRLNSHTEGLRMVPSADLLGVKRAGFNTVLLSAWVSPGKFGDLAVWDGTKFHRAGKTKRAEFILKVADSIQQAGLDIDLIQSNDARELNRLAAYSYISWAQSLESATLSSDTSDAGDKAEVVPLRIASTTTLPKGVKNVRQTVALPIFEQHETEALEAGPDGTLEMRKRSHLRPTSESVRVCDSCFLASTCPAYEPASSCAFNFPVEVRTDAQVKSLLNSVMELQATRVAFARFAEEVNGGYPDEVVGREMDRLFRMAERLKKVEEKRERLTVSVESESSGGGTGVLSRIFGERAAVEAPAAASFIDADVVVAEVIED